MPVKTIDIAQENIDAIKAICAAGHYNSFTEATNAILKEMFQNDHEVTVDGVSRKIRDLMVTKPYTKKDFDGMIVTGAFNKKFITNFNKVQSDLLKRNTFNFIKACKDFIKRRYNFLIPQVGTLENIAMYYPDIANFGRFFVAIYIDVKYATSTRISISRFLQLKLRNTYVNNDTNQLWDVIKNYFASTSYGIADVYSLDSDELEALTNHINQA